VSGRILLPGATMFEMASAAIAATATVRSSRDYMMKAHHGEAETDRLLNHYKMMYCSTPVSFSQSDTCMSVHS
jgi:hypothetical protein